jgi:hypothetical protein
MMMCVMGEPKGASSMPAIVEHPVVVQQAVRNFGHLFSNEPERRHFATSPACLSPRGRPFAGINSEFAVTTDQSCLNRWLNEGLWNPTPPPASANTASDGAPLLFKHNDCLAIRTAAGRKGR